MLGKDTPRAIWQTDRYGFTIEWGDGKVSDYRFGDLQRRCPCAQCQEESPPVSDAVEALKILHVGRYALQIFFTTGCSKGIYPYSYLRAWD